MSRPRSGSALQKWTLLEISSNIHNTFYLFWTVGEGFFMECPCGHIRWSSAAIFSYPDFTEACLVVELWPPYFPLDPLYACIWVHGALSLWHIYNNRPSLRYQIPCTSLVKTISGSQLWVVRPCPLRLPEVRCAQNKHQWVLLNFAQIWSDIHWGEDFYLCKRTFVPVWGVAYNVADKNVTKINIFCYELDGSSWIFILRRYFCRTTQKMGDIFVSNVWNIIYLVSRYQIHVLIL